MPKLVLSVPELNLISCALESKKDDCDYSSDTKEEYEKLILYIEDKIKSHTTIVRKD